MPCLTTEQLKGSGSKESVRARPAGLPVGWVKPLPPGFFLGGRPRPHWIAKSRDAVAGVDHVVAAVAEEDVFAGLAEHAVGAAVADQDVPVEGALHVLVGAVEANAVAAPDLVDPGGVLREGDDQEPRVRLGLGEGGVVAAGPADDRAAGAAAARRQQVAVRTSIEIGRAGQAADQAVGAVAAVELVGAEAGLDQVVLGAAPDRVVAESAGEAGAADRLQRAFDQQRVVRRDRGRPSASGRGLPPGRKPGWRRPAAGGSRGRSPSRLGRVTAKVSVASSKATMKSSRPAAADDLQPGPATRRGVELDVGRGFRRPFLAAGGGPSLGALAAVAALATVDRVAPAAAGQLVVARPAVDPVGAPVADQGVAEGRPFDALEAEQLVVAVAVGTVRRQRGPDAGALAAGDVGGEGGDVAASRPALHQVVAVVAVDEVFVARRRR